MADGTVNSSLGKVTRWWQGEKAAGKDPMPWETRDAYLDELGPMTTQQQGAFARARALRKREDVAGANSQYTTSNRPSYYQGNLLGTPEASPAGTTTPPAGKTSTTTGGLAEGNVTPSGLLPVERAMDIYGNDDVAQNYMKMRNLQPSLANVPYTTWVQNQVTPEPKDPYPLDDPRSNLQYRTQYDPKNSVTLSPDDPSLKGIAIEPVQQGGISNATGPASKEPDILAPSSQKTAPLTPEEEEHKRLLDEILRMSGFTG